MQPNRRIKETTQKKILKDKIEIITRNEIAELLKDKQFNSFFEYLKDHNSSLAHCEFQQAKQ